MLVTAHHLGTSVCHGFSCRTGGVSEGRYASLNLSDKWGDAPAHVEENLRRFAKRVGFEPNNLVTVKQVHGVAVVRANDVDADTEADAIWTHKGSGYVVGVRTADCVPVLLVDEQAGVCAAVHSGWRGTASNIVGQTVEVLLASGANARDLRAAIGPCIEVGAFEVGDEVAKEFSSQFVARDRGPRPHVDLRGCVRHQLGEAGLLHAHIVDVGGCTHTLEDVYFSYRRDGGGIGQQLSVIGWA